MESPFRGDDLRSLESEENDAFGHRDYAAAIVAALADVPEVFTLGLFGPWGTGKSTIVAEVARRLRAQDDGKTAVAIFDVWKYEGDSLRREFIRDVGQQLKTRDKLSDDFDLDEHTELFHTERQTQVPELRRDPDALRKALWHAGIALVILLAVAFALPLTGLDDDTVTKLLIPLTVAAATFIWGALGNYHVILPVQRTEKRLEFPDQFAESFSKMLTEVRAERLVIAIDNLDRCAPGRVAAMLSTIKTFLEPTQDRRTGAKRLVFVIAADDEALRRHLIAQELEVSGGSAVIDDRSDGLREPGAADPVRPETHLPEPVRDAVDEYLRKFFNGSLRILDVLDEDMRTFTRHELQAFVERHGLSPEDENDLVELTAVALKHNPRRLKQFINNLELRLRLLDARRDAERIQIDPSLLFAAKLAVLEEEFPEKYQQLRDAPRLLGEWETAARGGDDEERPDGRERDFKSFLRITDHITVDDIQPYVTLKQTEAELKLPRFGDFETLVREGQAEQVEAFLEDAGEKREGYEAAIEPLFRDQVVRRFWGAANGTVRTVLLIPELAGPEGGVATRMLDECLSQPELRRRLPALPAEPLLAMAARLKPAQFNDIVAELLTRFEDADESGDRGSVADALVAHLDKLSARNRERISKAIADEKVVGDYESYLALADAAPELVPLEVLRAATTTLEQGEPDLETGTPAYRAGKAAVAADGKRPKADTERFAQFVWQGVGAARGSGDRFADIARDAAPLIARYGGETTHSEVLAMVQSEWGQLQTGEQIAAFDLAVAVLEVQGEDQAQAHANAVAGRLFDAPADQREAWLCEHAGTLPEALAPYILERVAQEASGDGADPKAAAEYLAAMETDVAERWLGRAVDIALEMERYPRAAALLNGYRRALGSRRAALVAKMIELPDTVTAASRPTVLTGALALDPEALDGEERAAYAGLVASALIAGNEDADNAFKRVAKTAHSAANAVVAQVFAAVQADVDGLPNHQRELGFLVDEADRLGDSDRDRLGLWLVEAPAKHPSYVSAFCRLIKRIDVADPQRRLDFVHKLIDAASGNADLAEREEILVATKTLAGTRPSNARKAMDDHLEKLAGDGSQELREMAERVRNL